MLLVNVLHGVPTRQRDCSQKTSLDWAMMHCDIVGISASFFEYSWWLILLLHLIQHNRLLIIVNFHPGDRYGLFFSSNSVLPTPVVGNIGTALAAWYFTPAHCIISQSYCNNRNQQEASLFDSSTGYRIPRGAWWAFIRISWHPSNIGIAVIVLKLLREICDTPYLDLSLGS